VLPASKRFKPRPYNRRMGQTPQPVFEYVLWVQDPVEDTTEVTRDPDTDQPGHVRFRWTSKFVSASTPFPTPNVGDEIDIAPPSEMEQPLATRARRPTKIVTRVRHRIEASLDAIRCVMTVETRQG
jgi:hypothetical protein